MKHRLAAFLREPLLHFLLAGAAVFTVFSAVPPDAGERRIVVGEQQVVRLVDRFAASYRRPPSPAEVDGMIRDHIADLVYYREALRLGLDQDDEVVVRRMRSKMLALATARAEAAPADDAVLGDWLEQNPARYAAAPAYDFEQVYLGANAHPVRVGAAAILARLRAGERPALVGVPAPLPAEFKKTDAGDVAAQFGDEFAAALAGLPEGQWTGPVASGFGLHLVRIVRRQAPPAPSLDTVRQRVENDWRAAQIKKAREDNLRDLLKGYDVVIERP